MTKCFAILDLFVYMFFFLSLKTLLFCYGVWIVEKIQSSSLTIIFHNQWTFKCTRIKDLFTYDKNKYTCNYQNWDRRTYYNVNLFDWGRFFLLPLLSQWQPSGLAYWKGSRSCDWLSSHFKGIIMYLQTYLATSWFHLHAFFFFYRGLCSENKVYPKISTSFCAPLITRFCMWVTVHIALQHVNPN